MMIMIMIMMMMMMILILLRLLLLPPLSLSSSRMQSSEWNRKWPAWLSLYQWCSRFSDQLVTKLWSRYIYIYICIHMYVYILIWDPMYHFTSTERGQHSGGGKVCNHKFWCLESLEKLFEFICTICLRNNVLLCFYHRSSKSTTVPDM